LNKANRAETTAFDGFLPLEVVVRFLLPLEVVVEESGAYSGVRVCSSVAHEYWTLKITIQKVGVFRKALTDALQLRYFTRTEYIAQTPRGPRVRAAVP
jgi:hypothetical protein